MGIDTPNSPESGYFGIWNWTVQRTKWIGHETQFKAAGVLKVYLCNSQGTSPSPWIVLAITFIMFWDFLIVIGIKFQLNLPILIFWIKFARKEYFRSRTEKVNITIEFCIFELDYNHVRNFLRLFDGWANFSFTTSETMRDY